GASRDLTKRPQMANAELKKVLRRSKRAADACKNKPGRRTSSQQNAAEVQRTTIAMGSELTVRAGYGGRALQFTALENRKIFRCECFKADLIPTFHLAYRKAYQLPSGCPKCVQSYCDVIRV